MSDLSDYTVRRRPPRPVNPFSDEALDGESTKQPHIVFRDMVNEVLAKMDAENGSIE